MIQNMPRPEKVQKFQKLQKIISYTSKQTTIEIKSLGEMFSTIMTMDLQGI